MRDLLKRLGANFDEIERSEIADKAFLETLDRSICQVCGTKGEDRRTLRISMLYQLKEVSDVFKYDEDNNNYRINMCKGCRSTLMSHLGTWIKDRGRLAVPGLDDSAIIGFSTAEEMIAYRDGE